MRVSVGHRKTVIASAVATLSLGAAAVFSTSAVSAPARAASVPRCATSRLVVWIDTDGNGAAGSIFYNLKFTNLSGSKCTLRGFAGVSAVNLSGSQLGSAASRDHTFATRTVTLRNRGTASEVLRIVEAGNFPASTCRQTTAAGLRVFPPNQTSAKYVPFPFQACSRSGPTYLSVQAMR